MRVQYSNRKFKNCWCNGNACLSPAFIFVLKVCANLPSPLFDKGWYGVATLDVLNAIHLHKGCTLVSNKLGPIPITTCTAVNMLQISFNVSFLGCGILAISMITGNFEWTCMVMRFILPMSGPAKSRCTLFHALPSHTHGWIDVTPPALCPGLITISSYVVLISYKPCFVPPMQLFHYTSLQFLSESYIQSTQPSSLQPIGQQYVPVSWLWPIELVAVGELTTPTGVRTCQVWTRECCEGCLKIGAGKDDLRVVAMAKCINRPFFRRFLRTLPSFRSPLALDPAQWLTLPNN